MVSENPTWGAPRIHGELLKLGFEVSERTISRLMKRATPRQYCDVPILELHKRGKPELLERNVFTHKSVELGDFLESVRRLFPNHHREQRLQLTSLTCFGNKTRVATKGSWTLRTKPQAKRPWEVSLERLWIANFLFAFE
jgi:hypothetical protein